MRDESGFALIATLFLLVMLTILGVAALNTATDQMMAGRSARESAKTFYAADAGLNAIFASWASARSDTLVAEAGDSVTIGPVSLENRASYIAVLQRIDDGTASPQIFSVRVTGRSPGGIFGQRRLRAVVTVVTVASGATGLIFNADLLINGASFSVVPASARGFHATSPTREDEDLLLTFDGDPGDFVFMFMGQLGGPLQGPAFDGPLHIDPVANVRLIGVVPLGGTIQKTITVTELGAGIEASSVPLKAAFFAPVSQRFTAGDPSALLVLDRSF